MFFLTYIGNCFFYNMLVFNLRTIMRVSFMIRVPDRSIFTGFLLKVEFPNRTQLYDIEVMLGPNVSLFERPILKANIL